MGGLDEDNTHKKRGNGWIDDGWMSVSIASYSARLKTIITTTPTIKIRTNSNTAKGRRRGAGRRTVCSHRQLSRTSPCFCGKNHGFPKTRGFLARARSRGQTRREPLHVGLACPSREQASGACLHCRQVEAPRKNHAQPFRDAQPFRGRPHDCERHLHSWDQCRGPGNSHCRPYRACQDLSYLLLCASWNYVVRLCR